MGEFELIRNYFAAAPCAQVGEEVALGIGDDCALLALAPGEQLAISTDTLVAGVHFPDVCDPFLLGQRALAVSASDLAAMGARPVAFTLALTLPQVDADWLQAFARGLNHMALGCSLRLIGGDTTRGPLSLTLTVFGAVPAGSALTRSGACAGDLLCVGGALGDGAGALPLVLKQRSIEASIAEALLARYWSPQPQLALGQALRGRATSALDISDGLLADCGHIARASGVRLVVERDRLPMSDQLLTLFDLPSARQAALSGGDDYILAFTLPSGHLASLLDEGWPVHVIGRVEKGQGVVVVDGAGLDVTPDTRGYQHFDSAQ
ncbi:MULTISPECIES: thiamine-phosphate kinase [Pseudomonas syringae group]|uniref:Thiamine-monophosphate kinase n=2 Tax=Pseudomonas syringae group TaxID=136849 RepID=A0A2K4WPE0_PSESX|nr:MULTISPECIES: thiamine-phosphate kinase [Pseudomonas syringae group]AVB16655.1 thiamine-phosphate kinase [Pseudomonas amygdali pv. morsprunorum]KWS57033.1 thiamine monophosphate kinase [Pseudomonas amygdali pv. morsprunorum]KWS67979.1 thiamine monophosphate kinase [Pseudomonas amygdali pv. morsprunorum]MBD1106407.1 thiamine-phosphate kinase [Pseudomonas amygdali pv. morsprunorum]MBI6729671.1 thiamine-phosphate kinase [Pseudomonas amygdali]